jgi:hypothetical protein
MSVQGKLELINVILKQLQEENPDLEFYITTEGKVVGVPKSDGWDPSDDEWYDSGCVL